MQQEDDKKKKKKKKRKRKRRRRTTTTTTIYNNNNNTNKMSILKLSTEDRKTLAGWMGMGNCRLSLVYSAARDGWTRDAFLARCANRCPLVAVSATVSGYVFGGYATMPWVHTDRTYLSAPGSFLFRLKKNHESDAMKFAAIDEKTAVESYTNYGPSFSTISGSTALRFFCTGNVTSKPGDNFVTSGHLYIIISNGYQNNGEDNRNALTGGDNRLLNVEVYYVEEVNLCEDEWRKSIAFTEEVNLCEEEWRKSIAFTEEVLPGLKAEIRRFEPPKQLRVPKANILLLGRVGAGKSSFYNTLNSSFQGRVTGKASTGSRGHSVTTKYRQYEVRPGSGEPALRVRLCDSMGMEEGDQGLNISDVPYILDGNIKDGFQFNPLVLVTSKHPDYVAMPKDKDAIHVVALLVEATAVSSGSLSNTLIDDMRKIIVHANERDIPVAVLLTKIDEACPDVSRDLSLVYRSVRVQECVDTIAEKLGVSKNAILPLVNYHNAVEVTISVDVLALFTLRHLLGLANDLFDDMMQRKGLYDDDEEEEGDKHTR